MSQWRLHPSLPVFAVVDVLAAAVYVPGHAMPAASGLLKALQQAWLAAPGDQAAAGVPPEAGLLTRAAEAAVERWRQLQARPFEPLCLNVQLPYRCDLACSYCFTRAVASPGAVHGGLNRAAVAAAARLVARHCALSGEAFQPDLQGLKEPTLDWDELQWCVQASRYAALAAGVPWAAHLSTNGQLDTSRAAWLAETFAHITVSCDGPRKSRMPPVRGWTVRPRLYALLPARRPWPRDRQPWRRA